MTPEELTPLLATRLGSDLRCASVVRGPAGNGQETWFVEARAADGARRELVLRRSAPAGALRWTSRGHEFRVLRALAGTGLPVPAVHWIEEEEPTSLGRPYFVMDRLPGGAVAGETRACVAAELGALLACLHALDSRTLGLADAAPPADTAPHRAPRLADAPRDGVAGARDELARWRTRYLAERLGPMPLLGALLAWLEAELPTGDAPAVLLWGDPGPHNLLVEDGRVTALLDWELSHVGHPLDDLGAAVWACFATLDAEDVVGGYERAAGRPVDRVALRWFEALACVSRSVMLLAGVRDYVEGGTSNPALAGLGLDLVCGNLARAAALAGWGPAGPFAVPAPPAPAIVPLRPTAAELAEGVARLVEDELLPELAREARHRRRALKSAAGLLRTVALRARREHATDAVRAERARTLLAELGMEGCDLEEAAVRVESEPELADRRESVRHHLLADLATQRALLAPLSELYGAAPRRPAG